jgi:hypothetical protein
MEDLSLSKHFNYVQVQSEYKGVWNKHGKQKILGHKVNSHGTKLPTNLVPRLVKKRVTFDFIYMVLKQAIRMA